MNNRDEKDKIKLIWILGESEPKKKLYYNYFYHCDYHISTMHYYPDKVPITVNQKKINLVFDLSW